MAQPLPSRAFEPGRRKVVTASEAQLVRTGRLGAHNLPALIEPAFEGVNLAAWAESKRASIEAMLSEAGAILFRGFGIDTVEAFEEFIHQACGELLEYNERSSPRSQVKGNVFTSTDYPPEFSIFPHTEQSYNMRFPLRIAFFCRVPAARGGETPITDTRRTLERIPAEVRARFEEQGYLYVRNFGSGIGLSWQEAFQTCDRAQVEEHCRQSSVEFEWLKGGGLRTRQRRPVVARHPSGALAWFNHMTFFHVSSLEPEIQKQIRENFREEDLPNNTYYGDGSVIEPSVMQQLRAAYLGELVSFAWNRGDILLLDNVLTAHGRAPFTPPREVVVALARPTNWRDVLASPFSF